MLPIHALITRQAMRRRLAGALAGDPVIPERPHNPPRHTPLRTRRQA